MACCLPVCFREWCPGRPGRPGRLGKVTCQSWPDGFGLVWQQGQARVVFSKVLSFDVEVNSGVFGAWRKAEGIQSLPSISSQPWTMRVIGLSAQTKYHVRLRARNEHGPGVWQVVAVRTSATPALPQIIASSSRPDSVSFSWNVHCPEGAPVRSCEVEFRRHFWHSWSSVQSTKRDGNEWRAVLENLPAQAIYSVRVRCCNEVGKSEFKQFDVGTSTIPDPPTDLGQITLPESVTVFWKIAHPNGAKVTDCNFEMRDRIWSSWCVKKGERIDEEGGSWRACIDGLRPRSSYRVRICCTNAVGSSSYQYGMVRTSDLPTKPSAVSVDRRPDSLQLSFELDDPDGAPVDSCTVSWWDSRNSKWEYSTAQQHGRVWSIDVEALTPATVYEIWQRSSNDVGETMWALYHVSTSEAPSAPKAFAPRRSFDRLELKWMIEDPPGAAVMKAEFFAWTADVEEHYRSPNRCPRGHALMPEEGAAIPIVCCARCTHQLDMDIPSLCCASCDWCLCHACRPQVVSAPCLTREGNVWTGALSDLKPDTAYDLFVRSHNIVGTSVWSHFQCKTSEAPKAPFNIVVKNCTSRIVEWRVEDPDGAVVTSCELSIAEVSFWDQSRISRAVAFSELDLQWRDYDLVLPERSHGTMWTATLACDGDFMVSVRAVNAVGASVWSEVVLVEVEPEVLMYHGTSKYSAEKIERFGFRPSYSGMLGAGVYASRDVRKATRYPLSKAGSRDQVLLKLMVRVGREAKITSQNSSLQYTWSTHGYDSAWVPAGCGMVFSGLEESCIKDPARIRILGRL